MLGLPWRCSHFNKWNSLISPVMRDSPSLLASHCGVCGKLNALIYLASFPPTQQILWLLFGKSSFTLSVLDGVPPSNLLGLRRSDGSTLYAPEVRPLFSIVYWTASHSGDILLLDGSLLTLPLGLPDDHYLASCAFLYFTMGQALSSPWCF